MFRAMFQTEMEEAREGKVEIKDFCPEVVEDMLLFLYTGYDDTAIEALHRTRDHNEELLKAADQYQIDLLKATCEKVLGLGMNIKNCLTSLIIGDMYQAKYFKRSSMKMFVENMNKVLKEKRVS